MIENFTKDEIKRMTGAFGMDLVDTKSDGQLGRDISEEWIKLLQREAEGADVQLNWHMDPEREMTKEAYEHLGLWAKQAYSVAFPEILQKEKVRTKSGRTLNGFALTPKGAHLLKASKKMLLAPRVKARPQVISNALSTTQYSETIQHTGDHYRDFETERVFLEEEARSNLARVRHVINKVRFNAGMFLSLVGITRASQMKQDGNNIAVSGNAGAILGVGQNTVDEINNTSAMTIIKKKSLETLRDGLEKDHYHRPILSKKIEILRDFAETSSSFEYKQRAYQKRVFKALGMLQDIAEFRNDPISFTNYLQRDTSRISYSAQKMNPQTHHLARQMYGSSTEYVIKPGSGSPAEQAMLVTFGAHFFEESNTMPIQICKNMHERFVKKDHKLLAIAAVGRKLRVILANFDGEAAATAILNMDITSEGNITDVGSLLEVRRPFIEDAEVSKYISEAINHRHETINMIEEAVELANYIDSIESGEHFESSMRPLKVDGISNGIASIAMQLGITDIMYRVGVLRDDSTKILATFNGFEGNLQITLAKYMVGQGLPKLINDKNFIAEFGIVEESTDYASIRELLDLAVQQEKLFLKPLLIRFSNGQALSNMGDLILYAVTQNPLLSEAAEVTRWKKSGVANMLHRILAISLVNTLGKDVVEFTESIKDLTSMALIADEPIIYELASGTKTSLNLSAYTPDYQARKIDSCIRGPNGFKEIRRTEYPPSKKTIGAVNHLGFSSIRSKILPQFIIGMGGSTIVNTLSGASYRALQKSTGQENPYITAIYDCVIGDLGSFMPLMSTVNRVWKSVTFDHDNLQEIIRGAETAHVLGREKLEEAVLAAPNERFENKGQVYAILSKIDNMLEDFAAFPKIIGNAESIRFMIFDKANKAMATSNISRHNRKMSGGIAPYMTNKDVYELYKSLDVYMNLKLKRAQALATMAKKKRCEALTAVESAHVLQYAPDAIKCFNYP